MTYLKYSIQLKKTDCMSFNVKPFHMIFIVVTISSTVWNTRSFILCFNISKSQKLHELRYGD
jgi:hypothetical protein